MLAHACDTDIRWSNLMQCAFLCCMTVLHDCPASLGNIFSASLLASKHEIAQRVNESAFIYYWKIQLLRIYWPSTPMSADEDIAHSCFFKDLSSLFAFRTHPCGLLGTITTKSMTTMFLWYKQRIVGNYRDLNEQVQCIPMYLRVTVSCRYIFLWSGFRLQDSVIIKFLYTEIQFNQINHFQGPSFYVNCQRQQTRINWLRCH